MDGINGLAASQAGITGLGMGLIAGTATAQWSAPAVLASFVVGGAAVGFLPHNFPRARMFMGDVGSAPLGFILAILVIMVARDCGWWLLVPLCMLHFNFVLDTGVTLTKRILRRERWFEAHREHYYQRLVHSGKSHTFVTLVEACLQIICVLVLLLYKYAGSSCRLSLIGVIIFVWCAFGIYVEIQCRGNPRRPV